MLEARVLDKHCDCSRSHEWCRYSLGNALWAAKVDVNGITLVLDQLGRAHQVGWVIGTKLHQQRSVLFTCAEALGPDRQQPGNLSP